MKNYNVDGLKHWKQKNYIIVWNSFQLAGGFDTESMKAFEELRNRIHAQANEDNKPET